MLFNTGSGLKYLDVIEKQKKSGSRRGAANRRDHRAVLSSAGVPDDFAQGRLSRQSRGGPNLWVGE